MDITLELVRQVLRRALGFESFVATFIKSVHADGKATRSAQIDRDGRLTYSPEFVKAKVKSREDVFSLVMHELMHPLFNHYVYSAGALTNIACDAVIRGRGGYDVASLPEQPRAGRHEVERDSTRVRIRLDAQGALRNARQDALSSSGAGNQAMSFVPAACMLTPQQCGRIIKGST